MPSTSPAGDRTTALPARQRGPDGDGAHAAQVLQAVEGADEARAAGLVNQVVPAAEVVPRALALAQEITRGAPLAVAGTRALLDRLLLAATRLGEAEEEALLEQRRAAWSSPEARAARARFRERRRG